MGKADKTTTSEAQRQIDPRLQEYGGTALEGVMGAQSYNPWDLEYTGPRVAAPNQAQLEVMDETAGAGNAFGFNFSSAGDGLRDLNWNPLAMAKEGITPEMQELYAQLYGDGGLMSQYRLDGSGRREEPQTSGGRYTSGLLNALQNGTQWNSSKSFADWTEDDARLASETLGPFSGKMIQR